MTPTSIRVLIADDDSIIRLDLRQMLEAMGYEVVGEAEDGEQALLSARNLRPDICILDVKMPAMDGIDVASHIANESLAPVILLTAYGDGELVERARGANVFGYLVKPFKPSDLGPAIEVARGNFERFVALNKEVASLGSRLESRRLIEKAKGTLMQREGISEAEAYRRIQTRSMDSRCSMKEIAEQILGADAQG
ncbi:MAG: response regulator [Armatimonadetes bacterium]|nr:response regulator [Armatimonadota bacterium]NOG39037.1 response regulator [Armatimonadota bacterium]GIK33015.1 MAG: Fis family transcriptional regulator [Armatimonadota bacterium]